MLDIRLKMWHYYVRSYSGKTINASIVVYNCAKFQRKSGRIKNAAENALSFRRSLRFAYKSSNGKVNMNTPKSDCEKSCVARKTNRQQNTERR